MPSAKAYFTKHILNKLSKTLINQYNTLTCYTCYPRRPDERSQRT